MSIVKDPDPALDKGLGREDGVTELVGRYASFVNERPHLLSLLYDMNMLPEQVVTRQEAIRLAGFCEVWKKGEEGTLPGTPKVELDVDALAQEIRRVDGNHSLGAGALAESILPFIRKQVRAVVAAGTAVQERGGWSQGDTSDYVNGAMGTPG